jgi:hypothetical protein
MVFCAEYNDGGQSLPGVDFDLHHNAVQAINGTRENAGKHVLSLGEERGKVNYQEQIQSRQYLTPYIQARLPAHSLER